MDFDKNIHDLYKAYDYGTSFCILDQHFIKNFPCDKKMVLCVGANGAGKSTLLANLYQNGWLNLPYVNADIIAKKGYVKNDEHLASKRTTDLVNKLVEEGKAFCFESVFTHPSKMEFVKFAKECGYQITVLYVSTENSDININRVKQRVRQGGHNVPDDKIVERHKKMPSVICSLIPYCDDMYFFDNSKDLTQTIQRQTGLKKEKVGQDFCSQKI